MTKKKSKKRFASSSASPPDTPVLFIDRCAWSNRLGEALTAANIAFIPHHKRFAPDCPDEEWLPVVGRAGWIVLTRDKNIRRKPNELRAFKEKELRRANEILKLASAFFAQAELDRKLKS